jgi:hypothetical protein
MNVVTSVHPPSALLLKYNRAGAYTDCYSTHVARCLDAAEYVEAFYTRGCLSSSGRS